MFVEYIQRETVFRAKSPQTLKELKPHRVCLWPQWNQTRKKSQKDN